jgi:hypothetical protein
MKQTLVQRKREQDGRFALLLETEATAQRDMQREAARRKREQELRGAEENAGFLLDGIDPAEIFA